MNRTAVINGCIAALAASTAITSWCQGNYAKGQTVYHGANEQDPPPESDYPLIIFGAPGSSAGVASEEHVLQLVLGVGVFNSAGPARVGNTVRYAAVEHVAQLMALALAEVQGAVAALTEGGIIAAIDTQYDPIEAWPEYSAVAVLTVVSPWAVRENRIV